jgi:predicted lipid-binding transport protein (Tim44 family)
MRFKTLMTAAVTMVAVGVLSLPADVEAKRFGGGSSLGKQSSGMQRQAQPQRPPQQAQGQPQQAQAAAAGQRPAAASGASRWLGPLAGLAAGGLLASMFFGDAFDGFQIMDFLLIALLAVGGFMLFRMWRRNQARPAMAPAGAGGGFPQPQSAPVFERRVESESGPFAGRPGGSVLHPVMGEQGDSATGHDEAPAWFDDGGFLEGAKTHFIRLQAAWDQADFRDIRDYTTPQLFADLQRERQKTAGSQYTEVVRLNAELAGIRREDEKGVAEEFREIWHVQHLWDGAEGDWLIAGIQQVEG